MTHTLTDAQSLTIADALTHTLTASDRRQRRIGDALFFRNPIPYGAQRRTHGVTADPHPQRFGDALLPHQPDRALLTSSPLAVVAESDRASGLAFS